MTIAGTTPGQPAHPPTEPAALLGEIGTLRARLAASGAEVRAAQKLRHAVFSAEFAAPGDETGIDADGYDALCDHLIVLDTAIEGTDTDRIIGTYRLLPQQKLAGQPFYSDSAFDIGALLARHDGRRFLELGRSCVLPDYRSKRTIELLWQGIWAYCRRNAIDVMFGCASFSGRVPAQHAMALAFLNHHARASGDWAVSARRDAGVDMDFMPPEAIDLKAAMRALPPLIKGYLRLGATFGDGAVIDHAFASVDVLVVLPVEQISARYVSYYGADADRFAA
ncbi:MAG: GNAT family N-acetyltransferase [Phyllobacteriaceae bacterium]|jgi:putative hemolysin|nr:GNAT family N-acetyltransferase [Phyllobacteriaceae bacterium]